MKRLKAIVCALLAVISVFAFCSCGESHPMFSDFQFVDDGYVQGKGYCTHAEIVNWRGYRVTSLMLSFKKKADFPEDEFIEFAKGCTKGGVKYTEEQATTILQNLNLYIDNSFSMLSFNGVSTLTSGMGVLYLSSTDGTDSVEFKWKSDSVKKFIDAFEISSAMICYKVDSEEKIVSYDVEKDEYEEMNFYGK